MIMEKHICQILMWNLRKQVKTVFQEEAVSCMWILSGPAALELGMHP